MGRCADYALRDNKNVVNVFIHAALDSRRERAVKLYDVPEKKADEVIIRIDKQRASYYNFYTCQKWGRVDNYDLALDSSLLGIDGAVELLEKYVEIKEKA